MRLLLGSLLSFGLVAVIGCGGRGLTATPSTVGSSNSVPASSSAQPSSGGETSNTSLVTVTSGTNVSGVNVTVTPAVGTENATAIGKLSDGFAANTGVIVHPASTETILAFGPGLSSSMSIVISGPNDIGVSNVRNMQAKDGTPGLAFDAVFGSSTAPGARTVYLKSSNNDITAFVGGLEVLP